MKGKVTKMKLTVSLKDLAHEVESELKFLKTHE